MMTQPLVVMDAAGIKHEIRSDDFGMMALHDILGRTNQLEEFIRELLAENAIVHNTLKARAEKLTSGPTPKGLA